MKLQSSDLDQQIWQLYMVQITILQKPVKAGGNGNGSEDVAKKAFEFSFH